MNTYRVLFLGAAVASVLASTPALADSSEQWHRPANTYAARASLVLATQLSADSGIGVAGAYDIPLVSEAGPGRLLIAPAAHVLVASDREDRLGCDVNHQEQAIGVGAQLRYVLDLHEKIRPWLSAGLGVDYVHHGISADGPCAFDVDDDDSFTGPAVDLALGLDVDLSDSMLLLVGVSNHSGEDDFNSLFLGLGWRF